MEAEKEERKRRLARILDSESEDEGGNGDDIDYKGLIGEDLTGFLQKIDLHVKAEQKILDAWQEKDEKTKGSKK